MSVCSNYASAIDELNSLLTPTQFTYLITTLSTDGAVSYDDDKSCSTPDELAANHTSLSPPSPSSLSGPSVESIPSERRIAVIHGSYHRTPIEFKPPLPPRQFSRPRPPLLPLSSLETVVTGKSSVGAGRGRHHTGNSQRSSSILARGGSFDESINNMVYQAVRKYDQIQLPVALPFDDDGQGSKGAMESTKRCSQLPVCNKLVRKYARCEGSKLSRTSSTETIIAESLPDEDTYLTDIGGKIANEPVNPFPTMRSSYQINGKKARPPPHFTDKGRIEEGIDISLKKFQDYKDVSEFFSKSTGLKDKLGRRPKGNHGKAYDLSRRVTNPLYKQYDPTGYHKSEDELAVECIQMICNEFNAWIKSLVTKKKQQQDETLNRSQDTTESSHEQDSLEIGPEFLIQILRTELELPENEV